MDPWDAQRMLDMYIHDYMIKKNMHEAAEIFAEEANVAPKQVVINPPDGFLMEWWGLFWDVYCSRLQHDHEAAEATWNEAESLLPLLLRAPMNHQASGSMPLNPDQAIGSTPQIPFPMFRDLELNQHETMNVTQTPFHMPNPEMSQQRLAQFPVPLEYNMQHDKPISVPLAKMYEQACIRCSARDVVGNIQHPEVGTMSPMVASSSKLSSPEQQNPENTQQWLGRDDEHDDNLEGSKPVIPTPQEASQATLPERDIPDAGKNKGVLQSPVTGYPVRVSLMLQTPVTGYPVRGIGVAPSALGHQLSNSLVLLAQEQQQIPTSGGHCQHDISPSQAEPRSGKLLLSASGISCDLASPMLLDDLTEKNFQDNGLLNHFKPQFSAELRMLDDTQKAVHGKIAEKQATGGQRVPRKQQNNKPKQKNTDERGRKRKQESNSLAVENPSDVKDADLEKSMDEESGTYFSAVNDNADEMDIPLSTLPPNSSTCDQSEPKGFSFKEVGSLHSSNNKLLCCHFSSQGRLLAGAGHEKKVLIWNMDNFSVNSIQGHSDVMTDIRFRPNSTVFATSSFDRSVLVWDASKPSKYLSKLTGHTEHVMSLDFHPRKVDLLCSSASNNEIRMWNVNNGACTYISQGAGRQVRFQTRFGELLATARENFINLIDVETKSINFQLKGHIKDVRTFCWDTSGKYIASVSEDSARIWSINSGGRCIYELQSAGNQFESCIFHPGYSQLLVIGTYKSIQLWNPTECNRTWSYHAHDDIISAMADSPQTETIATASHDQWFKLWK